MKDREFDRVRKMVRKVAHEWVECMGLRWWKVSLEYARDESHIPSALPGNRCLGVAHAEWKYLEATITFNIPALAEQSDKEIERTIVHELCHVLVNEMREWGGALSAEQWEAAMMHEERTVTTLANAFLWTRAAGRRERGKKRGR